jgi:hypothetical protein
VIPQLYARVAHIFLHCLLAHTPTHPLGWLAAITAEQTILPTLSYGLAEARGDLFSASNGLWGNAEFGYNPVSNNLGASTSSGSTNSLNVGSSEQTGNVDEGARATCLKIKIMKRSWPGCHSLCMCMCCILHTGGCRLLTHSAAHALFFLNPALFPVIQTLAFLALSLLVSPTT